MAASVAATTRKVDFDQIQKMAPYLRRYPIMLRGSHGIGKSSFAYALAKAWGLPVIERRVSQMTEGDLLGLPFQENVRLTVRNDGMIEVAKDESGIRITRFVPMDWLAAASVQPVVLFFDEVDRGTNEVRMGVMQLTDSRTLAGVRLHPGTIIISAVNAGIEEKFANYGTNTLDPAELDRWTVFDVRVTKDGWCKWARANGVHETITNFIMKSTGVANSSGGKDYPLMVDDSEPNKKGPSPRSWTRLSDAISELLEQAVRTPAKSRGDVVSEILLLATGFVGSDTASDFTTFLSQYETVISADDILDGVVQIPWALKNIPESNIMQIVTELGQARFGRRMTMEQLVNFAHFFMSVDNGKAATMYSHMTRKSEDEEYDATRTTNLKILVRGVPASEYYGEVPRGFLHTDSEGKTLLRVMDERGPLSINGKVKEIQPAITAAKK
jgi:hypothetical protein